MPVCWIILSDETLRIIAHEIVQTMRRKCRVRGKRILRKHGYPPDKQEKATQTVLEQAELLCGDWAA
jgi:type I restriction enzyme R subunit